MSNHSRSTADKASHEHGTMETYVIGFILSVALSLLPYYLVVTKAASGTALLVTILVFAVLQMLVQIIFFLHLGRGPKPRWNLFFFIATVGIILIVVGGSIMIMSSINNSMVMPSDQKKKLIDDEGIYQIGGAKTGACQGQYANHKITIKNDQINPLYTDAQKCDTLTFINEDNDARKLTFGSHPEHGVYAGETEIEVRKVRSKSITLSESGTFKFHDDDVRPEITGSFTVSP